MKRFGCGTPNEPFDRRDKEIQMTAAPVDRLDTMLSESIEEAQRRESSTFESICEGRNSVVLHGAGGLGRRTVLGLSELGIEVVAFSDNRKESWGTTIEGIPVLSPDEAAKAFASTAVFIVTIWRAGGPHRFEQSFGQLRALGCDVISNIAPLYWAHPEHFLPFYALDLPSHLLEQRGDVRRGFDLLEDDASREEYVTQVQWRLFGDPSVLASPVPGPQYLVDDVALPSKNDVVLDCGAYDGDTLRLWLEHRGPTFDKYWALEPDPDTRDRLRATISTLQPEVAERVEILPFSVSNFTGTAKFAASGALSSAFDEENGIAVDVVRLDELAERLGRPPTFLKADIEGAELDALEGGAELIKASKPMIAIGVYHRQDHLWRVPLAVRALWSEYRCYLRPHNEEGWDLDLYAVPPDRALAVAHSGD
jgi:FkbM family methyltransferase